MNRNLFGALTFLLLLAMACFGVFWTVLHSREVQYARTNLVFHNLKGQTSRDFVVNSDRGIYSTINLRKPLFVEIFATWCPNCQEEVPALNKLYAKYKSRMDFVSVSGSHKGSDAMSPASLADTLRFKRKYRVTYPIAFDKALTVFSNFHVNGFPTFVIIEPNKVIAYNGMGLMPYSDLEAAVESAF